MKPIKRQLVPDECINQQGNGYTAGQAQQRDDGIQWLRSKDMYDSHDGSIDHNGYANSNNEEAPLR